MIKLQHLVAQVGNNEFKEIEKLYFKIESFKFPEWENSLIKSNFEQAKENEKLSSNINVITNKEIESKERYEFIYNQKKINNKLETFYLKASWIYNETIEELVEYSSEEKALKAIEEIVKIFNTKYVLTIKDLIQLQKKIEGIE